MKMVENLKEQTGTTAKRIKFYRRIFMLRVKSLKIYLFVFGNDVECQLVYIKNNSSAIT